MESKAIMVMVHTITNGIIQIAVLLFTLFFYDYSLSAFIIAFVASAGLIFIDYNVSKRLLSINDAIWKNSVLIHFVDLILVLPPLLLLVNTVVSSTLHNNVNTISLSPFRILFIVAVIAADTCLAVERFMLYSRSRSL